MLSENADATAATGGHHDRFSAFTPGGSCLALLALSAGAPAHAQVLELTVVLRTLATSQINDGCGGPLCIATDRTAEVYGDLQIDGVTVLWNDHRCESGCLVAGQYTTDIAHHSVSRWRDFWLKVGSSAFRPNNNLIVLTRTGRTAIARPLSVSFVLRDHDELSGDDAFCVGSAVLVPAGSDVVDWLGPASSHTIQGSAHDQGVCFVSVQIFGKLVSLR